MGDPLGFLKLHFAAKYRKTSSGDPLATKKVREKVAQCRKKSGGGTLQSRPVLYLVKN